MEMEVVLSIVGSFLVIVGAVNAFFLRGIFQDLNAVKVHLARIFERNENEKEERNEIKSNQKEIFERLNIVEREVLK